MKQVNVLFVCMGNICRSPTAEGLFRQAVEEAGLAGHIKIDSAGTHSYHIGSQPDARAQAASLKRGIDLSNLRGRQAENSDFSEFDYVLAMDNSNYSDLMQLAGGSADNLHLFLDFSDNFSETEVPDPYYGGDQGFEHVLDLIEDASKGLLTHIRQNNGD
ncbi:Low molecular weight protein tyrosine phosphatase [hydrothermal vent metagenome]|uniref:Low molecular weight protein tyrosine phosphatase n=1 Tax=hydrothermal vent metagenome TaxID=652676 RepID=A0A3B0XJL9_9ZZZZ